MKIVTKLFLILTLIIPLEGLKAETSACHSDEVKELYSIQKPYIEDLYRHFHQNPELSFHEEQTWVSCF